MAAEEFRRLYAAASTVGDEQASAERWPSKCYWELGQDGSAVVHDALIHGMSAKRIAESRGLRAVFLSRPSSVRLRRRARRRIYDFQSLPRLGLNPSATN
jgi:hypothetical protein